MIIKVFIISYIIFFQPIKTPLESICPKDILCNHGSQTAKSDKERIATTFATDLLKKKLSAIPVYLLAKLLITL